LKHFNAFARGNGQQCFDRRLHYHGHPTEKVIIRAIGPSLPPFFPGALANPILELRNSFGGLIASNDNWRSDQRRRSLRRAYRRATILESAIVQHYRQMPSPTLPSFAGNNGTGIRMEKRTTWTETVDSKLANISTRGFVQTGDSVMIGD